MRSNREKKKPKSSAKTKTKAGGTVAAEQRPLNIGAQRPGAKGK